MGEAETEAFWREFLRSLRARGLDGVKLAISDAHARGGELGREVPGEPPGPLCCHLALFWAAFTGPGPSAWLIVAAVLVSLVGLLAGNGFVIVQPNQAKVAIFFGRYVGTVRTEGCEAVHDDGDSW